jgi:hypothetical protein
MTYRRFHSRRRRAPKAHTFVSTLDLTDLILRYVLLYNECFNRETNEGSFPSHEEIRL